MDYKYIEQLLDLYFRAETTLQEESILRSFFQQEALPEGMEQYRAVFSPLLSESGEDVLGDDFDRKVLSKIGSEALFEAATGAGKAKDGNAVVVKARRISLKAKFMPIIKAAAVVVVVLSLGMASQKVFTIEQAGSAASLQAGDAGSVQSAKAGSLRQGVSVALADSVKKDTVLKAESLHSVEAEKQNK